MTARAALALAALLLAGCSATPAISVTPDPSASLRTSQPATPSTTPAGMASPTATPAPAAWTQLDVPGPAAREDHTWTVAGDGRTALLFGGRDGGTVHGDLWAFDLDADIWTELSPAPGPAARFGHEAVWVDDVGLVVFAGQAGTTFFNDLWAYDPDADAWTELPASGDVPVARYGTCAAIGPDGRLWISHGFTSDGVRFKDTRAYDFRTGAWTDETPGGTLPVERCLHGCWWTADGRLVLFGGQTTGTLALGDRWLLDDGEWTRVRGRHPPERNLYAHYRVERAGAGATFLFGGQSPDGSYLDDLWVIPDDDGDRDDAIGFTISGELPPARAGAEMIVDAGAGRALLFGGRNASGTLSDLWSISGTLEAVVPLGD
jgi:galactose oxidase-like protein